MLLVVSAVVIHRTTIDSQTFPLREFTGDSVLGGWCRYDCGWYSLIADQGYSYNEGVQSTVAFFPGYPLALRTVGAIVGDVTLAGVLVSLTAGFGVLALFWRWSAARLERHAAVVAIVLLALYPYAWYLYGAVYGDALFVALALTAFLLVERDHTVLAGLVAAAATGTRAVGIAVVIGIAVRVLERRGGWRQLRPADVGVLLGFGGLAAWCTYLWVRFDDPFVFSSVQQYWGQPSSPRTWFKIDFGANLLHGTDRLYAWGLFVQGSLTGAALLSSWFVRKRFGLGYGLYVLVLVGIPAVGSQDFQGLGRYLIGAFPTFALAGEWLADRDRVRAVVLPVSAVLLVVGTALFANGKYLS